MYSAISGLKTHQIALDVTANDLSNVNTVGYKSARTTFKESLSQIQRSGTASTPGSGGSNPAQVGLGTQLGSIDNIMLNGAFQATGNPLDVAVSGEGWLRVGTGGAPTAGDPTANVPAPPNNMEYTRAGNFTRNDAGYLITQDGAYVIGSTSPAGVAGAQPAYLHIPAGATDVAIAADGAVSFVPPPGYTQPPALPPVANGRAVAGYLTLAKFSNESGLERVNANRWRSTGASGQEAVGTPAANGFGQSIGGTLEMSNVDLATEFTDMISAQRGFQANSRVISTADEMLNDLVNIKR
ncbi:MAG TPA: flagellar hook-basal body complex protein [Solirubrobacteraceae bacterium]|nr:flagellar hook-basal body complex protein [Solirubrobacteraceae bacterium]